MKTKLIVRRLILPLLIAALIITPLLGVAVVGEHRYEVRHPAYARHLCESLLGQAPRPLTDDWEHCEEIPTGGDGGVTNLLVMGRDSAAGLTDVMLLLSLDADARSVQVLQLPRDTYASYTSDRYKKINGAYRKLGGRGVVEFLNRNMDISIDHYLCLDLAVFGEIVDALGGVPLHVPVDMDYDDPTQNLHIHLKAGDCVLSGEQAQMFVRFRSGYASADLGRMDAQKLFLAALAQTAKTQLNLTRVAEIACSCFGKVKTDLTLRECISCARALVELSPQSISFATLQGESVAPTKGGAWYYVINRECAMTQLGALFGTPTHFDPDGVFTDASRNDYQRIYTAAADRFSAQAHTAEELLRSRDG